MVRSIKIDILLFYTLIFFLPLGLRKGLGYFGTPANEWNGAYLYATDLIILGILVVWSLRVLQNKSQRPGRFTWRRLISTPKSHGGASMAWELPGSNQILGAFVGAALVSLVVSGFSIVGIYRFLKLLEFSLLFLWVREHMKQLNFSTAIAAFVCGALLQSFQGVAQFFGQKDLGLRLLGESPLGQKVAGVAKINIGRVQLVRAYGLFPHPNVLAAFLAAAVLFIGELFSKSRWRWLPRYFVLLGAMNFVAFGLLLTFSRAVIGSLILVMAAGFAVGMMRWKKPDSHRLLEYTFAFFVFLEIWAILLKPVLTSRAAVSPGEQAVTQRIFYTNIALRMMQEKPLFGVGVGQFTSALPHFLGLDARVPSVSFPAWIVQPAHNIYLLVGAETGLMGLAAFLVFLTSLLLAARRNGKNLYALLAVCCLLTIGLFDHFLLTLQQGSLLFWILLSLLSS